MQIITKNKFVETSIYYHNFWDSNYSYAIKPIWLDESQKVIQKKKN